MSATPTAADRDRAIQIVDDVARNVDCDGDLMPDDKKNGDAPATSEGEGAPATAGHRHVTSGAASPADAWQSHASQTAGTIDAAPSLSPAEADAAADRLRHPDTMNGGKDAIVDPADITRVLDDRERLRGEVAAFPVRVECHPDVRLGPAYWGQLCPIDAARDEAARAAPVVEAADVWCSLWSRHGAASPVTIAAERALALVIDRYREASAAPQERPE